MQIDIQNYRAIKSAQFTLENIVLITGDNAAGKSAICQAVGAVISGQPMPIPGIPKMMAGMLVRGGEAKGHARMTYDAHSASVDWPGAKFKTKGEPRQVSMIAAGLESVVPPLEMPDSKELKKARSATMINILDALPKKDDLTRYLGRQGINEETAAAIWETIERQGWDASNAHYREQGSRLKGQWEATTGENYGSRKAEAYTPNEWEPELAGASEDQLQAAVTDARDALEGMIAVAAIDGAERERLQSLADQLADAETSVTQEQFKKDQVQAEASRLHDEYHAMQNTGSAHAQECPHCGGAVAISGVKIIPARKLTQEEIARANDLSQKQVETAEVLRSAGASLTAAINHRNACKSAADTLEGLSAGNASTDQINVAREQLKVAETRLTSFTKKTRADRLQNSILQNVSIVAALDVGGVRQEVVSDSINKFLTDHVAPLSMASSWPQVEIAVDMSISFGGRQWEVLSESERYRVRVLLQLAIAKRQGAFAVVIDAADILGKAGRNGLINLIRKTGLHAVIGMTFSDLLQVPDLPPGIGQSYWVEEGVLYKLADKKKG